MFNLLVSHAIAAVILWVGLIGAHTFDDRIPRLAYPAILVLVIAITLAAAVIASLATVPERARQQEGVRDSR